MDITVTRQWRDKDYYQRKELPAYSFAAPPAPSVPASNHNSLLTIQGGSSTERYHLDLITYNKVTNIDTLYAAIGGSTLQDFNVKDLYVQGTINSYSTDEINVGDSWFNLGVAVPIGSDGGLRIFSEDDIVTPISQFWYDTSESRWQADSELLSTGEFISTSPIAFRMIQGNYGSFWYNTGTATYLMLTASGDQYGTFNSLRSFYVNNSTGSVGIETALNVSVINAVTANIITYTASSGHLFTGLIRGTAYIDSSDLATGAFRIYDGVTLKGGLGTYEWASGVVTNGLSLYSASGNLYFHVESGTPSYAMSNTTFGSPTFSSGFAGAGVQFTNTGGVYSLTVDNLVVRREMQVYSLNVEKIRSGNGSYWFSDGMKVDSITDDVTYYYLWIDDDAGNIAQPFVVGDIVSCQNWTGSGIKYYEGSVGAVAAGGEYCAITKASLIGGGTPAVGDEIVRVGSSVISRAGAVYITSNDTDSPYIDVVYGKVVVGAAFNTKVRLGRLDGITDTTAGLDGTQTNYFGLYSDNVHLTGHIHANTANIGGWITDSTSIRKTVGDNRIDIWANSGGSPDSPAILAYNTATGNKVLVGMGQGNWNNAWQDEFGFYLTADYTTGDPYFQMTKNTTTNVLTAKIANWNFDASKLYNGGIFGSGTAGVEINATSKRFSAYYNATNYIKMYYTSSSDWGLVGVVAGVTALELGSTTKLGGWDFDSTYIWSGTKKIGDGYTTDGITLFSGGALRAKNFYITTAGDVFGNNVSLSGRIVTEIDNITTSGGTSLTITPDSNNYVFTDTVGAIVNILKGTGSWVNGMKITFIAEAAIIGIYSTQFTMLRKDGQRATAVLTWPIQKITTQTISTISNPHSITFMFFNVGTVDYLIPV